MATAQGVSCVGFGAVGFEVVVAEKLRIRLFQLILVFLGILFVVE